MVRIVGTPAIRQAEQILVMDRKKQTWEHLAIVAKPQFLRTATIIERMIMGMYGVPIAIMTTIPMMR